MKRLVSTTLITFLVIMGLSPPVMAEMATMDDAQAVAKNWITLIIEKKGGWGGSETAEVAEIQEFKRDEQVIGYFCHVEPQGFIVISLYKQLAPVKAYSATCDLDPESEKGMADLIKGGMGRILDQIEVKIGKIDLASIESLEDTFEINYQRSWEELESDAIITMNYQEGEVLLSSRWHQGPPYNEHCPDLGCTDPANGRAVVGCVATASSQIMRYWNWPPYGVDAPYSDHYDWPNMLDRVTTLSTSEQINAVAELCREVGIAEDMHYGCDESWTQYYEVDDALEDHFRYSTNCNWRDRDDYSAVEWFNIMKSDLNANRPVQYRVEDHQIVADGWQEIGSPVIRQYHMNYGWGWTGTFPDGNNTWYTLDALHLGHYYKEKMLVDIFPAQALYGSLSGTYARQSFPYRYFDRDATGDSATFEAGQNLQFLPDITVTCTSATGNSIRFEGSSSQNTRLFTRGDRTKGIRIYDGSVKLNRYGSIQFE
ncbi:MAG TPA: hypothetical protein EYP67_05790 [Methanosarcinales archaeon]|nr:hypothetical protein [Methanosarcinales archaeon]